MNNLMEKKQHPKRLVKTVKEASEGKKSSSFYFY